MIWEAWVIASIALLSATTAMVFVVMALPGIWFMALVAGGCSLWQPEIISWKAVLTLIVFGIISEAADVFASAVGVKKLGGTKRGALGSMIGTMLGAIAGTIFIPIPILGTILGGILGAGAGALMVERGVVNQTWTDSLKSGGGAAAGRAVSIFVKLGLTIASGLFFVIAAFV